MTANPRRPSVSATTVFPLITSLLLLSALAFTRHDLRTQIQNLAEQRDSALAKVRMHEFSLVVAGDSVPDVAVIDAAGDTSRLRDVVRRNDVRYLYLYREDCPACEILAPFIDELPSDARDQFALIQFHPSVTPRPVRRGTYAWVADARALKRQFTAVPSLVVISADGRIQSVAHASLFNVAKLMDLHGLLSLAEVTDAVDAARVASSLRTAQR
jgi:hypothetical protein